MISKNLHRFACALVAALCVGAAAFEAQAAKGKTVTLLSSSARVATTTGSTVDVAAGATRPITGLTDDVPTKVVIVNSVTAASGTLMLELEGSNNGSVWATLPLDSAFGLVSAATTAARLCSAPTRYIRAKVTHQTAGTGTYSVTAQAIY